MINFLKAAVGVIRGKTSRSMALVANWMAGLLWFIETKFLSLAQQAYGANEVVYACLRLLRESVPEPPLIPYTETKAGKLEPLSKTHPLMALIRRPNELMTEYEFWELATLHLAIIGRSTWWKQRGNGGQVLALWPLRPDRIGPVYQDAAVYEQGQQVLRGWSYQVPGTGHYFEIPRSDVLAFNFPDPSGESGGIIEGLGPLAVLARQIAADNEATKFVGALLANYAAPTTVLKLKKSINPGNEAEVEMIKALFRHEFGGANRGTPAIIDAETDIQTIGFNLQQLEFPELREISETRIAATLGVPAGLVGLRAGLKLGADRSNFAESREFFAETTLANYWRRFEEQYTNDIAAEFGDNLVCTFDTSKVKALAHQREQHIIPIKDGFAAGVVTRNEYRAALNLDPVEPEVGDVFLVPSTMTEIPSDAGRRAEAVAQQQAAVAQAEALLKDKREQQGKLLAAGNGQDTDEELGMPPNGKAIAAKGTDIVIIPLDDEMAAAIKAMGANGA